MPSRFHRLMHSPITDMATGTLLAMAGLLETVEELSDLAFGYGLEHGATVFGVVMALKGLTHFLESTERSLEAGQSLVEAKAQPLGAGD